MLLIRKKSIREDERAELKRLRKEISERRMEKEIFRKATVDSIGRSNNICSQRQGDDAHGSDGTSKTFCLAEGGDVASMEERGIARLMRDLGLQGVCPRKFRLTTDSDHKHPIAGNVLARNFKASRPNEKWTTDITYIWTAEGWLYLAVVMNLYSRRIVGWATADHMETSLCLDALGMALGHRANVKGLIHHSDRGVQYASHRYRKALDSRGIECSMNRRANCWNNAVAESFFGELKNELIYRRHWMTREDEKDAIVEYIEIFYNRIRRHSTIGYVSPVAFEKTDQAKRACAA